MVEYKKKRFNRRVTILVIGSTQNEMGGNEPVVLDSYERWACIEDKRGFNNNPYEQTLWQDRRRVILRRFNTQHTQVNYQIDYKGQRMKIESIQVNSEGFQHYEILECINIDSEISMS